MIPITAASLAFEVRAIREAEARRTVVLVEGPTDSQLYRRFFADPTTYRIVSCLGKDNLLGAMERITRSGVMGVVALCDSDFDLILGNALPPNTFPTDQRDSESMCWVAGVAEDCISESLFLSGASLADVDKVRETAVNVAWKIGSLRLANHKHHWSLNFKAIEAGEYVRPNGSFKEKKYLTRLLENSPDCPVDRADVARALTEPTPYGAFELINGHDLASLVDALTTTPFRRQRRGGALVEAMLRLSLYPQRFAQTIQFENLENWQGTHDDWILLSDELAA